MAEPSIRNLADYEPCSKNEPKNSLHLQKFAKRPYLFRSKLRLGDFMTVIGSLRILAEVYDREYGEISVTKYPNGWDTFPEKTDLDIAELRLLDYLWSFI